MSEGISALVGLAAPLAIQLINKYVESTRYKNLIAQGICIALGVGVAIATGEADATNIIASAGIVATIANVAYKQYFQTANF